MRSVMMGLTALLLAAGMARADFFDGKTLDDFEGLKEYWSVKDGAIVGYTPKDLEFNTFLCSKKKYKDFELTFQVRLKDGIGNSGVQIRSKIVTDDRKGSSPWPARSATSAQQLLGQPLRRALRRHDEGSTRGDRQEGGQAERLQRLLHQVRRQARHHQGQRRDDRGRRLREDAGRGHHRLPAARRRPAWK